MCSCSPQNLGLDHFKLVFCRGRQRNVPKHITHVQGDCFCSLNLLFVAFSLPSSLLKFPTKAITTATPTKTSSKWLTFTSHVSKEVSEPWTKLTFNRWSRYHKFLWCQISKYQSTENLQNQKAIGYTDDNSKNKYRRTWKIQGKKKTFQRQSEFKVSSANNWSDGNSYQINWLIITVSAKFST